jgi:hypothetical protein
MKTANECSNPKKGRAVRTQKRFGLVGLASTIAAVGVTGVIGVLAATMDTPKVSAQIATKVITVTLSQIGDLPSGVTGVNYVITCKNTINNPGEIVAAFSLRPGQSVGVNNFFLTPTPPATTCKMAAFVAGTSNTALGELSLTIGGITPATVAGSTATSLTTGFVPLTDSTVVAITMKYYGPLVLGMSIDSIAPVGGLYEVNLACDKGGPKEVFALAPGERRVYSLPVGTNCLVTETQNRGAIAAYQDTTGSNFVDGRVAVGQPVDGCPPIATAAILLPNCWAGVLITNLTAPPTTTTAVQPTTTTSTTLVPFVVAPVATASAPTSPTTTSTTTTTTAVPLVFLPIPTVPSTTGSPTTTLAPTTTAPQISTTVPTSAPLVSVTSLPVAVPPTVTTTPEAPAVVKTTLAATKTTKPVVSRSKPFKGSTGVWARRGLKPASIATLRTVKGKLVRKVIVNRDGTIVVKGLAKTRLLVTYVLRNGTQATTYKVIA